MSATPQPAETPFARWLALSARADDAAWDELRDAHGSPRAVWSRFFDCFDGDASELTRRAAAIARQIHDDGVTHNVYDAKGAQTRPWSLELLPLIVEPADWARIERGIAQRAALLDAMLADLYGAQRLLHDALLPPALLFRHEGYLRPLVGVTPPAGLRLHIAAFDIARGPDGAWWVISQRTQTPSGLGYVLQNRQVISRVFPEAFRELRVQHLASSYRRVLDTVYALAAELAGSATPRVVLLTPGRYTETYFEHTYLARYLGLPLVEGGDLTVRDDRVFLKTVEGLEPVHGVLRRLDDIWCDPLELRPDSALGVPGLVQAVRAGSVVMANALGSGFLESPAVEGFLPAIARRLLGENLVLPSLPTWWCGERAAWHAVRGDVAGKVVRASFDRGQGAEVLSAAAPETQAWSARIESDPDAYTLQGRLRLAGAPMWAGGRFDRRASMLRVYAIVDVHRRWHVLPGGMTRVAADAPFRISMQRGGSSLDTWVLTEGTVDDFSMMPRRLSVDDIAARTRPVASRTGENLFWLGRYSERTAKLARLARATLGLIDADADAPEPVLAALTRLAEGAGLAPWGVPSLARSPHVFQRTIIGALGDASGATSVAFNLAAIARAADSLRERLSSEHWRLVRTMQEDFTARMQPATDDLPGLGATLAALDHLLVQLGAVTGAQSDRMTRDHGWRLLAVGRLIERLVALTRAFDALIGGDAWRSAAGVDLLLELFDSAITFRARYQRHDELLALADVLVLDSANPRAFAGVLRRLRTELSKLPGTADDTSALLDHIPRAGPGITLDDLRDIDDEGVRVRLLALAERLHAAGAGLSDAISRRYFAHADVDRLLRT